MKFLKELYESHTHLVIMNANALFNRKAKTIEQAVKDSGSNHWNDSTVIVAKRETGWNWDASPGEQTKWTPIFIFGSHGDYGVRVGQTVQYTEDTGMGHKNKNKQLEIQNIVHVKNGEIVHQENNVGINEKRKIWVFK